MTEERTLPDAACHKAITLGTEFLPSIPADPQAYTLTKAETVHGKPHLWRLTFKLRRLIPDSEDTEIGAGGELFVEADLTALKARLLGYGE